MLTLKSSVSMSLLGTLTALTCRAGPLSLMLLSLELGVTHRITGWVFPSSWLSTWKHPHAPAVKLLSDSGSRRGPHISSPGFSGCSAPGPLWPLYV